MRLFRLSCGVILPVLLMLTLGSCSKSNPLNRQAVSGKVLLDGQPLDRGTISFVPKGDKGTMSGATVLNGEFSIPAERGLPAGDYVVRISAADDLNEPVDAPGESNKLAVERIPAYYNSQSKLIQKVSADEPNVFMFDLSGDQRGKGTAK